jgi:hemerythrin-like domain-containing protein
VEERVKTVELMIEEHRLIERMLRVLEESAAILEDGGTVPPGMLAGVLEFLQRYADAGHHAKEEEIFFPALVAHGVPAEASLIRALQVQHESGRLLVREMRDVVEGANGGTRSACRAFAASAQQYITLLREHIRLENEYFTEYAEEHLSPGEDAALGARMAAVNRGAECDRFSRMVSDYEEMLLKC